jgi:hypothetical protein
MMKPPRKYASAAALRAALEDRLKRIAQEEALDFQRLRRQAAFDRLLCRLFAKANAPWLLKGGYAMELRLKAARTTKDIDVALRRLPLASGDWDANLPEILDSLREAGSLDLHDCFVFVISDEVQDLEAAPNGGARFPVDAQMAGRTFAKFHLDVSAGDILCEPWEMLSGRDWLGFAGIAGMSAPAMSREEQFAEKLHAYTVPREGRQNSRVKDLVDLVLLIECIGLDETRLREAIRATFHRRKTHDVPPALTPPPPSWGAPFSEMATKCGLNPDTNMQFGVVNEFFKRVNS